MDEELFTSMKEKEKLAQKGSSKNAAAQQEKYQAAKESYEAKHEEVAKDLADLLTNKFIDFEPKFAAIVQAQSHLFAKMSNSFQLDVLGIAKTISKLREEDNDSQSGDDPTETPSIVVPKSTPTPTPTPAVLKPPEEFQYSPNIPPRTIRPANTLENPLPPPRGTSPIPTRNQTSVVNGAVPLAGNMPTSSPYYTADGKLSIVPEAERYSYENIFRRQAPDGKMIGANAFEMFSTSGLDNQHLALIWEVSDQDKDGNLVMEEFVLAMYLINAKRRNLISEIPPIPPPQYLIKTATVAPNQSLFPPPPATYSRNPGNNNM